MNLICIVLTILNTSTWATFLFDLNTVPEWVTPRNESIDAL